MNHNEIPSTKASENIWRVREWSHFFLKKQNNLNEFLIEMWWDSLNKKKRSQILFVWLTYLLNKTILIPIESIIPTEFQFGVFQFLEEIASILPKNTYWQLRMMKFLWVIMTCGWDKVKTSNNPKQHTFLVISFRFLFCFIIFRTWNVVFEYRYALIACNANMTGCCR